MEHCFAANNPNTHPMKMNEASCPNQVFLALWPLLRIAFRCPRCANRRFWVNCSQPMGMKGQLAVARDCYHVLPCWSYRRVMNCAVLQLCSNVVLALFFHFLSIVLQVIKLRASARRCLASPPGSYTNHSTASTASTEICHEMSRVVLDQNCSKTCSKDVHFPWGTMKV